ncbi:MAG: hypothetical protein WC061_07165, partial [Melioribacteraceae bacterium]
MKLLHTGKSKFLLLMAFLFLGIFSMTLLAQSEEDSKFDQLKGKVEKITVKVDGKDVVFEGKDADKLADRLKSEKKIRVFSHGELDVEDGRVMIFKSKNGEGNFDFKRDGVKKEVKVEDKDGKKLITVTTTKDGKEETKTYEGEEAEKFLKEEKGMKNISVVVTDGEGLAKENVVYFTKKLKGGRMGMRSNCCCGNGCGMGNAPMHGNMKHKMLLK